MDAPWWLWLFVYLLVGATYGTMRVYQRWDTMIAPLHRSGMPPWSVRVVILLVIIGTSFDWPRSVFVRIRHNWRGRGVPEHIRRLAKRTMQDHIEARGKAFVADHIDGAG